MTKSITSAKTHTVMKWAGFLLFFGVFLMMSLESSAKEMSQRLGVGPKAPFSHNLPAIAVHYFPNADYMVSGAIGINTAKDYSQLGLQGGIRRILFEEKNLNFFLGGSLGLISNEVNGENSSGFQLMALAGAEFFLQGLENLGINIETGVGVSSLKDANSFYTVAHSPIRAGFIFYF